MRPLFLLLLILLTLSWQTAVSAQTGFTIGPSMSASFYNPDESGHGILIHLLDEELAWMCWFAFDLDGNRAWICALGTIVDDTIFFEDAFTVEGGKFPPLFDAEQIVQVPWGSITVVFTGCDAGSMEWTTAAEGFQSGIMPLIRLTTLWGNECEDPVVVPLAFSFFVTSQGSGGLGGNLGGLTGADAICQGLATAAGVGDGTWRAYLSTTNENARDRIGTGPWTNFYGDTIAANVESLHTNGLSNSDPQHIFDEYGNIVEVDGQQPNHDIFTGSEEDGTLATNATCQDWTTSSIGVVARVGHSDTNYSPAFSYSWNSAHDTQDCSEAGLLVSLGIGRLYCFALREPP